MLYDFLSSALSRRQTDRRTDRVSGEIHKVYKNSKKFSNKNFVNLNYIHLKFNSMKFSTANLKNGDYNERHVVYVGTQTGSFKRKLQTCKLEILTSTCANFVYLNLRS